MIVPAEAYKKGFAKPFSPSPAYCLYRSFSLTENINFIHAACQILPPGDDLKTLSVLVYAQTPGRSTQRESLITAEGK